MPSYSNERREAVVAKLLPPRNLSVAEVARQEGISEPTVYKWRKEAREQGRCLPNAGDGGTAAWSSKDKFGAVLETAAMNGAELAEYCRRRGVYPEQIAAWRQDCEQAASLSQQERRQETLDAKAQRERIRELERDLGRKNAALAETAALLTLSKKARAIGGTRNHDRHPGSLTCSHAGCGRTSRGSPPGTGVHGGRHHGPDAPALDP